MIGEGAQVSIDVRADGASVSSSDAVSIGAKTPEEFFCSRKLTCVMRKSSL